MFVRDIIDTSVGSCIFHQRQGERRCTRFIPHQTWRQKRNVQLCLVRSVATTLLALAADAVVLAYAAAEALLAPAPDAVMLAYLRSSAFLALALAALVGTFARLHGAMSSPCSRRWPSSHRFNYVQKGILLRQLLPVPPVA